MNWVLIQASGAHQSYYSLSCGGHECHVMAIYLKLLSTISVHANYSVVIVREICWLWQINYGYDGYSLQKGGC